MKSRAAEVIIFLTVFLIIGVIILFGVLLWNRIIEVQNANIEPENFQTVIDDEVPNVNEKEIKTPGIVESPFDNIKGTKSSKENENNNSRIDYSDVDVNKLFYNQLNDYSKIIYKALEKNKGNMKTGTYKIEFGNTFSDLLTTASGNNELSKAYQTAIEAFTYDNPDVFYISPNKMYLNLETITKSNKTYYNVFINNGNGSNYLIDEFPSEEQVNNAISEIEQVKNQIIRNKRSNTYENVKMVHDYLVENVEYDRSIAKNNIYNIYGTMVNGEAVCEGYARSFKYLMDALGIESTIVIGKATNSEGKTENHAWNYVKIDGNFYAVDCTWDDPIIRGGRATNEHKYKYFLKGSSEMSKDHAPSGQFTEGGNVFTYPNLSKNNYR